MKKLFTIFIALVMCMSGITGVEAEEEIVRIYVSCNGNDDNSGTYDSPLKTLEGARNMVRSLQGEKAVEVIFGEGEYRFSEGVEFTEEDSGSENAPVTYKAAEGEKVIFKGSLEIPADGYSEVTNGDVLSIMDEKAKGRIVQYDLRNLGYNYSLPDTTKIQQFLFLTYPKEEEYVELYLDGKEQMLSQWPNGDDEYTVWTEAVDKGDSMYGTNGATIKYDTERPKRWKNYKYSWIGGYPSYNYRYERNSIKSVDAENKTLTLATPSCFGFISKESKAWKIFNLIEEIDLPGEWYIDKDTMILYIYPPEDVADKKLEISFLTESFFDMKNVSYVNIEGIEFAQHRATAVNLTSCEYINIDGCTFRNIGARGVMTIGTERTYYNYSRWKDAGHEIHIKNCVFDNIGGSAVWLEGGNIDTLERGNCSFENNLVMRVSSKAKNVEAIKLWGVGNTVKNNNLSSGSFHAITYGGSYHTISNNEFYDVNKCTDDVGVIYSGRDYAARGTEVSYNYIHDNEPHRNVSRGYMIGIYLDDSQPGQNVHHNILLNNPVAYFASGHSNDFQYNTIVNSSKESMMFYYRDGWSMGNSHTELLEDKEIYFEAFPEMETTLNSRYEGKLAYCDITGNLSVNSAGSTIEDMYTGLWGYGTGVSHVKNNVEKSECSDFVNPDKQDYRLKSGSATANSMPDILNESYDIEEIGIKNIDYVFNEETSPFSKLYPENDRHAVNPDEIEFAWERVFGANNYRLVIAKDKDMTDIVYDEVVPYNIQKVEGLEKHTKYYWQVWANNTSREFNSTWVSDDEPKSFNTLGFEWITEFPTENLIKNGGFEKGLEGWETDDSGVFSIVKDTFKGNNDSTKSVANGQYAIKAMATDKSTSGYIYQEIDAALNTNYVFNMSWFNLTTAKGSVKIYGDTVSNENLLATVGNIFGGEVWYSSTAAFNSGEHEKLIVKIDFSNAAAGMYYCIDNMSLRAAGNIQNIDFENGYDGFNIRNNTAFEISTEKPKDGNYSLKFTSGNGYHTINVPFALDANHYEILFDYYIVSGSLGYRVKYAHANGWSDYNSNAINGATLTTSGSWQKGRSGMFAAGTNKFVEIAFQNMATNSVVYIDNIRLVSANQAVDKITVKGENRVGGKLYADADVYNYYYKFEDPVNYQWQVSVDKKTWTDAAGETDGEYSVVSDNAGKFVRVKVTTTNRYNSSRNSYYSKPIEIASYGDLIYKDIRITDTEGNIINRLEEKINIEISLVGTEEKGGEVYFAIFNADALCDVKKAEFVLKTEQINKIKSSVDLSDVEGDIEDLKLKVFIWDDEMKPIDKENFEM